MLEAEEAKVSDSKRLCCSWALGSRKWIFLLLLLARWPVYGQEGPVEIGNQEMDPSVPVGALGVRNIADPGTVGPLDLLAVKVFGLSDFNLKARVSNDGAISLPFLGHVPVAGQTTVEIEEAIEALLLEQELLKQPHVSVFIEEFVSRSVSVQGAVKSPGVYQMLGRRTLLDLLGEAGGLREREHSGRIIVLRYGADGQDVRMEVDAERLAGPDGMSLNILLEPGDIVMIPHEKVEKIYVSGAVVRPGPVEFRSSESITILQAIAAAGGPTQRANINRITIVRKLEDGTEERFRVSLKRIKKGKEDDRPLRRNDVVIVPEWFL